MISQIVIALLPIVLLIALGYLLRRHGFLPEAFWSHAERLSYFVLLPALFINALATANFSGVPVFALAAALAIPTLVIAAVLVISKRFTSLNGPDFTSVFQGGVRFNNYVGITAAVGLFGAPAVALAAVVNAVLVPLVNVLCVLVFARYGGARPTLFGILKGIGTNPLVVGCAVGLLLQVTGAGLPVGIDGFVRALGQASLPLGLLCVGAAFEFGALGRGLTPTVQACVPKFVLLPVVTALCCIWLGLDAGATMVAVLFQALPTASSSYVMARQLGGNAPLMAGIVASQTVAALLVVPAVLLIIESVVAT